MSKTCIFILTFAKVIREAQKTTADGIDEQLMELQKELLQKANNKEAYDEIADQIFKLREQREKLLTRFSSSASSVKNALLTPLPETRRLQESMNCRTSLNSSVPTLLNSTRPW